MSTVSIDSELLAGKMRVSVSIPQGFDLSKEDEIELFSAFIDAVPRWSYLRGIFESIRADVETTIRNDFTTLARDTGAEVSRLLAQRDELRETVKAAQDELKRKQETTARELRKLETLRDDLRETVRQIKLI